MALTQPVKRWGSTDPIVSVNNMRSKRVNAASVGPAYANAFRMKHRTTIATSVLSLALAVGCSKEKNANGSYFGKTMAPPGDLAKIKKGMTLAEAQKAVPAIKKDEQSGDYMVDSGYVNLKIEVSLRKDVVDDIIFKFKGTDASKFLSEAFGPGTPDKIDKERVDWKNPATGYKAHLSCSRNCYLYMEDFVPLKPEFFPKEIGPIADLAKVKVGMTEAEVKAALPNKPAIIDSLVNAGPDEVLMSVYAPKATGVVQSSRMLMPEEGVAMLKTAWGEPVETTTSIGQVQKVWFNAKTGARVTMDEKDPFGKVSLVFDSYMPYTQMLGEDKDVVAILPKPFLGLSAAEIKAAYADTAVTEGDDVRLRLPPSELEMFETRVHFFIYEGKARNARFKIPYGTRVGAKEEIMAFMKKKWGEPTQGTDYKKSLIFHAAPPVVKVSDDTISKGWDVEIADAVD